MRSLGGFLVAGLPVVLGSVLHAQTAGMRELTVARHQSGQTALIANLNFTGTDLRLRAAGGHTLYRYQARYGTGSMTSVSRYDETTSTATFGLDPVRRGGAILVSAGRSTGSSAVVELTPSLPVSLEGTLASGSSDIDLGGLALRRMELTLRATAVTLRFSRSTTGSCDGMSIRANASEVNLLQLGNSRCEFLRVTSDAGPATLDFSGDFPELLRVSVEATLGTVVLRLPRDVGVRLVVDRWLANVGDNGFTRDGDTWVSQGYAGATRKLEMALTAAAGGVRVEWIE